MNYKKINLLDCTLRDGGYYNNWNFKHNLIKEYLILMSKLQIKYIEFGFISFTSKLNNTGNINRTLLKKLNFPKNLHIGVMINTKELFNKSKKTDKKKINILFKKKLSNKISFIRFACNVDELNELCLILNDKRFNKFKIFINLMQASEIKNKDLIKIIKLIKINKIQYFYLADSFGSFTNSSIKKIYSLVIKNYNKNIGFHAHDNLGLAYSNTITLLKKGVNFIDCTLMGMGRGAGNLKTEEIYNYLYSEKNFDLIKKFNKKYFLPLKKKYNWGKNIYFRYAGINKIHPTYVQEIITNEKYKKKDYLKILQYLKKNDTKKYDPFNLYNFNHFNNDNKFSLINITKYFKNKNIVVLGPSKINPNIKSRISKLLMKNNHICVALNSSNIIGEKLISYRVLSHPQRILSDMNYFIKNKTNKIIPLALLKNKIVQKLSRNSKILNYGLYVKKNVKHYVANNTFCTLEKPLAILYILSILEISKIEKLLLVGFKGFENDNPFQDNTQEYLRLFKQRNSKTLIKIIGPSKYKL